MKTDWIFDGIEVWINEGNGRMAKIRGMTLLNFLRVLGRHYIRPPHFASKVSYSAAPHTSPLYQSCFFLILNTQPQGFTKSRPYQCKYLPARSAKTKIQNETPKQKFEANKALQRTKKAPRPTSRGAFFIKILHCSPVNVAGRQECGD